MGLDVLLPHLVHGSVGGGSRVCSLSVSSSGGGLRSFSGSGAGYCFSLCIFHVDWFRHSSSLSSI